MSFLKNIWRSTASLKNIVIPKYAEIRPLSTSMEVKPQDCVQNVVQFDRLYKRIELEMRGIDAAVLLSYSWFCTAAASHLGIDVTKSWALRKAEKERFTLLKSRHVHKKHKVQYEVRTYFRFIHLQRLTGSTCDTYLEYIERNLPEGCALKVTKVECQPLPEHLVED